MTAFYLTLVIVYLVAMYISWQKGKPWFAGLGLICGVFPIVGAIRLAKPNSHWALDHYGPHQMAAAVERFPKSADQLDASGGVRPPIVKKVF